MAFSQRLKQVLNLYAELCALPKAACTFAPYLGRHKSFIFNISSYGSQLAYYWPAGSPVSSQKEIEELTNMRISARLLLVGLFACVSTFAAADSVNISLQTAYCFIQHSAPCDGGLAQVTNNGSDGIKVDSIVASGWLSGHTDDITVLGGPAGGVQTISGGSSLIFNSFLFGSGDDTSNDGKVADVSKGIIFTIHVTDTVDGAGATFTFYDNAASHYAFVDGPCVAVDGIDADASNCLTAVTDPNGTITGNPASNPVPEPGSIALLGTGLLGLAGSIRRKFLR